MEQAVVEAAFTGGNPPWPVIKAQMCHYFGCLPSALRNEPTDELLLIWQANSLYEETVSKKTTGD